MLWYDFGTIIILFSVDVKHLSFYELYTIIIHFRRPY